MTKNHLWLTKYRPRWWFELTESVKLKIRRTNPNKCTWCPNERYLTYTLCKDCLDRGTETQREFKRKVRDKWQQEGFCVCCHNKMHEFFDSGHTNCYRCRERRNNHLRRV